MKSLSIIDELDSEPTKAPGNDGIPVKVLKCVKGTLLKELHEILCQCWGEGEVPQDMRDANIVTLYKNKSDTVTITAASLSSTSSANSSPKLS